MNTQLYKSEIFSTYNTEMKPGDPIHQKIVEWVDTLPPHQSSTVLPTDIRPGANCYNDVIKKTNVRITEQYHGPTGDMLIMAEAELILPENNNNETTDL